MQSPRSDKLKAADSPQEENIKESKDGETEEEGTHITLIKMT
jgi:hypothetical protein